MLRLIFCLFFAMGALQGQTRLTLTEAWQVAQSNNLTLQQLEKILQQAAAEVQIQRSAFLPVLSFSAGFQHVSEIAEIELPFRVPGAPSTIEAGVHDRYDVAVSVQQPLFTGFRTRNLVNAARQQRFAQEIQKEITLNELRYQIGVVFYQLQLNLRQQEALAAGILRAENQLQVTRNRFLAGQTAAFDTLEAANRKLQLESQQQQLRNFYQVLLSRFRFLLNTPEPVDVAPVSAEDIGITLPDPAQSRQFALAHRPEVRQIAAVQAAQRYRIGVVRSQFYPQIFAEASYHYARPGVNFFRNEWMDYYTVGVGLQWSLWNWGKHRRQVEQARVESQKLSLQEQQLVNRIAQQVTEAVEHLKATREQLVFQQQLVVQERERYRIARSAFEQGLATSLDMRNAETALTQTELLLQQRRIEWLQQKLQLDLAMGQIGKN